MPRPATHPLGQELDAVEGRVHPRVMDKREVMDKYGDLGDMAEPLEIDAVSITPL
jgi:hypothetical protein